MFISWLLFYFASNIRDMYVALCLAGLSGGLMEAPVNFNEHLMLYAYCTYTVHTLFHRFRCWRMWPKWRSHNFVECLQRLEPHVWSLAYSFNLFSVHFSRGARLRWCAYCCRFWPFWHCVLYRRVHIGCWPKVVWTSHVMRWHGCAAGCRLAMLNRNSMKFITCCWTKRKNRMHWPRCHTCTDGFRTHDRVSLCRFYWSRPHFSSATFRERHLCKRMLSRYLHEINWRLAGRVEAIDNFHFFFSNRFSTRWKRQSINIMRRYFWVRPNWLELWLAYFWCMWRVKDR